jgi:sugar transferase EpsL
MKPLKPGAPAKEGLKPEAQAKEERGPSVASSFAPPFAPSFACASGFKSAAKNRGKRAVDVTAAAALLALLWPVLLLTWLLVRWRLGKPALFRQVRPGLHGRPFTLLKFRTMTDARDAAGNLKPDAQRLTRLGRFLRAASLDELPQLWNVLRGEMSLVGPRPLLFEYLDRYTPEQARRHDVRPGITGWAQVNGRQDVPFSQRLRMDVWYVDHWNLRLDAYILLRTLRRVLSARGVRPGQDVAEVDDVGLSRPRETPPPEPTRDAA